MGELLEGPLGGTGWGLIAGIAVGTVGGNVLRPALSGLVRTPMVTGDRLGGLGARAREQLVDIVVQGRAEHAAAQQGPAETGSASAPPA